MATEPQVMDTFSPSTPPTEPSAVGYFSVPAQGALTAARNYPIMEGESSIGRDEECEVCIPVRALSRQHAHLLIEDGEHFVQDLGSRNCSYRRGVRLRPNAYYEVTSGIELTFADVKCQYFIGQPPTNQIAEPTVAEGAEDQTQDNTTVDEGDGEEEGEKEGEGVGEKEGQGEKEGGGEGEGEPNDEATQGYTLDEEEMECEPVNLTRGTTALMDSPPSSPLLGGGGGGGVLTADGGGGDNEGEKEGDNEGEKEGDNEGEKEGEGMQPAQNLVSSEVAKEDSGSETELEGEGEGEAEDGGRKDFEFENTVPYPVYDVDDPGCHGDGGESSEGAGPFDGGSSNAATLAYDIESREVSKRESKQVSDSEQKRENETENKDSSSLPMGRGASEGGAVAPDDDQTLAYNVDTETDSDSDAEVRSKVETPRNLAMEGSHTADIPGTSSIIQSHKEMMALREMSETEGKTDAAPVIKSGDESREDSEFDELPVPVTTATHPKLVTRATRSKQKTLVVEMVRVKRGRGRGRGRGTPSLPLDSDGSERSEDQPPRERGKRKGGRGRGRGRGRGGRGRRAQFLCESSEEQTVATDDASDGVGSAAEKKEKGNGSSSSALPHPPPTSAVSMVRRIVEGMTLKSEESRLPEKSGTSGTVAMETIESPDFDSGDHVTEAERSCDPKLSSPPSRGSTCDVRDDQSDRGSVTSSGTPSVEGRGRGRKRVKKPATPHIKLTTTPKLLTRGSRTPTGTRSKPKVMFTGVIDEEGRETVRILGGELVDSVYDCTHLIADKVRRTVKFLCCLARGCHIINDQWLGHCREEGRFLATDSYLVKDRTAERQHKFSLSRSLELARCSKLLSGQKVFLSPSTKPPPRDMADIIRCSGGEVLTALPDPPGVGLLIVASLDDLSMLSSVVEAGVKVHSTELILGGVLRQELDLTAHQLSVGGASSSDPAPSSVTMESTGRRKRKTAADADTNSTSRPSTKRRRK